MLVFKEVRRVNRIEAQMFGRAGGMHEHGVAA
jgi:hypothetical protein